MGENLRAMNKRNGKIELMRFLFSVMVALYHLKCILKDDLTVFSNGFMAVEFFFIVSGYLMAKSLSKYKGRPNGGIVKTSLVFAGKKYISIMYYYVVSCIITSIAWIPYFHLTIGRWVMKVFESIPNFLLLQMFGFETANWCVPTWYLSAMVIVIFILTPILIKYHKIYSVYIAPVLSLFLLGFMYNQCGTFNHYTWDGYINFGLIRAFAEISLGCTCYYVVESGVLKRINKRFLSFIALAAYFISFIFMIGAYKSNVQFSVIILLIIAVIITFYNKDTFTSLNNKFIYFLGKLSFPIYLCHSVCRFYITKYIDPDSMPIYLYIFIYLILVVVLSIICMLGGDGLKRLFNKLSEKQTKQSDLQ